MMIRRRSSGTKQDDGQDKRTTRSKHKEQKFNKCSNTVKQKMTGQKEEKQKNRAIKQSPRTVARKDNVKEKKAKDSSLKQAKIKKGPVRSTPSSTKKIQKKTKENGSSEERKMNTLSPKLKTQKKDGKRKSECSNSSSSIKKATDSDNGYTADKESLSSQISDLYDFENSEENFESPPVTSSQRKRKQTSNTSSNKRRKVARVLNNSTNIALKPAAKERKKTGLNVSKGTLRTQAMKKCLKRSVDSGVFMTPSPALEDLATFNGSISSKPTSTPTGVVAQAKNDKKLGAPLLSPPDLSPVKRLQSPNSGGIHGKVLTSPEVLEVSPAITNADSQGSITASPAITNADLQGSITASPANTNPESQGLITAESDDIQASILDISKTYKDCSFRTLDKKGKGKGKKSSKKQNRYSTSKYDVWADQKATEFDEIEQFELSIE